MVPDDSIVWIQDVHNTAEAHEKAFWPNPPLLSFDEQAKPHIAYRELVFFRADSLSSRMDLKGSG